jgi:hypothetical protein
VCGNFFIVNEKIMRIQLVLEIMNLLSHIESIFTIILIFLQVLLVHNRRTEEVVRSGNLEID